MNKIRKEDYVPAKRHVELSTGDVIQILRGWKGWTQEDLAELSGISATNISLLENNRVDIGKKRAESLAKAFGIHPAIIMFPEFESSEVKNAA
jgi:transcriptional regulator with XRE-family HTH domain